jgi:hypothetical protein
MKTEITARIARAADTLQITQEHLSPSEAGPLAALVGTSEILGAETIIHGVLQSGERLSGSVRGLRRGIMAQTPQAI